MALSLAACVCAGGGGGLMLSGFLGGVYVGRGPVAGLVSRSGTCGLALRLLLLVSCPCLGSSCRWGGGLALEAAPGVVLFVCGSGALGPDIVSGSLAGAVSWSSQQLRQYISGWIPRPHPGHVCSRVQFLPSWQVPYTW